MCYNSSVTVRKEIKTKFIYMLLSWLSRTSLKKAGGFISAMLFCVFCVANLAPEPALADPTIAHLTVGTVTSTTAVITWTTDVPSDSFISYVGSGGGKVQNEEDDNLVTSHKITLMGLTPSTQYAFTVNSADAEGNNVSLSGSPFITPAGPATPPPPAAPVTTDTNPASEEAPTTGLQYTLPTPIYPTGTLAQEGNIIYFLMAKDQVKIPFSNLAAFTGLGYKLLNVQKVDVSSFRVSSGYIISSPTEEHPWGSWLRASNGTVYYSHSSGLIGVSSMDVFTANGGKSELLVPMNEADKKVLDAHPALPVLEMGDSRLL